MRNAMSIVAVVFGGLMLLLAGALTWWPVTSTGYTAPRANALCTSGLGQLGQAFSAQAAHTCSRVAVYASMIGPAWFSAAVLLVTGVALIWRPWGPAAHQGLARR